MPEENSIAISLREYLESIIDSHKEINMGRFNAMEKAKDIAFASLEERLDRMNEFREQLNTQAATFVTRETYEAKHDIHQKQIDELLLSKASLEGKASQGSVYVVTLISVVSAMISLVGLIIRFFGK